MSKERYFEQANLMLDLLPLVAEEKNFALKGGTAINFFYLDLPRLSVDIDLTYLPLQPRDVTLNSISDALKRISIKLSRINPGTKSTPAILKGTLFWFKLLVQLDNINVKIEPNLVLRGTCYPVESRRISKNAEDKFQKTVEMNVLSESDLYGGKICAALDRQHPRDWFDIRQLQSQNSFDENVRTALIVYLASCNRPIHELINPNLRDFRNKFETEFMGMSIEAVSYEDLTNIRKPFISDLCKSLSKNERQFLISFTNGAPDFNLIQLPHLSELPGIKWKLMNIEKMDSKKRKLQAQKLESVLYSSQQL